MLAFLKMLAGPIISMVTGGLNKFQARKQTMAEARVAWETAAGESMKDSWKDEYVTIIITWPIVQMFIANIMTAFTGANAMQEASDASFTQLGLLLDTPYGDLMTIVVLAAVGIKAGKSLLK